MTDQINEGVLDDADDEGWMAKSQLYQAAQYAIQLHKMIQDDQPLEGWVQAKITKAADYLSSVKHYMEYEAVNDYPEMPAEPEMAAPVPAPEPEMEETALWNEKLESAGLRKMDEGDMSRVAKYIDLVSEMILQGASTEAIAEGTGLSESEIELIHNLFND